MKRDALRGNERRKKMTALYYKENGYSVKLGEVLTNNLTTIDDVLNFLEIDMDKFAAEHGWDGWNYEALELVEENAKAKKYLFIEGTDKGGRWSEKLYGDKAEAVEAAKNEWNNLAYADKKGYLNDAAPSFRVDELEMTAEQLAAVEADEEDFVLGELAVDTVWDALAEYKVVFGYEPFTGGEAVEYVRGVASAEEAAEEVYNGLDDADGYNMIFLVSSEYTETEKFFFKTAELWVANRETGDLIEQVASVQAGLDLIDRYEEDDRHEGIYEPNFYAVVRADDREEIA